MGRHGSYGPRRDASLGRKIKRGAGLQQGGAKKAHGTGRTERAPTAALQAGLGVGGKKIQKTLD
jgi:hypothetical protein